jgi:probable HAF family extracellular repeat protein
MRIPLAGNISTKDGAANKNSRLTNTLAEVKKNGTTLATVRPGLSEYATVAGNGNGLVCFNGTLVSVYGSSVLIPVVSEEYVFNSFYPQDAPSNNVAYAVTPNGEIVVGVIHKSGIPTAFISEPYSGFNYDISDWATAYAVSANGSTVVGNHSTLRAFRWTLSGGIVSLGTVNGVAYGISSDGTVITGFSGSTAFRWTSVDGLEDLGTLSGAASSQARGISGDGTTIVGYSLFTAGSIFKAFKWTEAGGMVDIGTLGGTYCSPLGVSSYGEIVGGSYVSGDTKEDVFHAAYEEVVDFMAGGTVQSDQYDFALIP